MTAKAFSRLDAVGASLSTLCAMHCLAMPFLLAFLPAFSFLANEKWERGLCLTLVLLASACLAHGCRQHRHWRLLLWLGVGGPLVLFAQWLLPDHSGHTQHHGHLEAGIMFVGACA
jgi:hypothetical protein